MSDLKWILLFAAGVALVPILFASVFTVFVLVGKYLTWLTRKATP